MPGSRGAAIATKAAAGSLPVRYAPVAMLVGVAPSSCGAYLRNSMMARVRNSTVLTVTVFELLTSGPDAGPSVYEAAALLLITVPTGVAARAGALMTVKSNKIASSSRADKVAASAPRRSPALPPSSRREEGLRCRLHVRKRLVMMSGSLLLKTFSTYQPCFRVHAS